MKKQNDGSLNNSNVEIANQQLLKNKNLGIATKLNQYNKKQLRKSVVI